MYYEDEMDDEVPYGAHTHELQVNMKNFHLGPIGGQSSNMEDGNVSSSSAAPSGSPPPGVNVGGGRGGSMETFQSSVPGSNDWPLDSDAGASVPIVGNPYRDQANAVFNINLALEKELRNSLKNKSPADKEVAILCDKIRDNFEAIIFLDFEFSREKEIEPRLWKVAFYKVIEEYRKLLRKPEGTEDYKRLMSSFRNFLFQATNFYNNLLAKLQHSINITPKELQGSVEDGHGPQSSLKRHVRESCYRCYIFLGDIARYSELHNDNPTKNWRSVCDYYYQALDLMPYFGNPYNQLAVVATYCESEAEAVYYYFLR